MSDREITAEFAVEDLTGEAAPVHPRIVATVTLGAKTDLGRVRENNEDKFDWLEPEEDDLLAARGRLYAVADGMGGHSAGQIASEVALKTLIRSYFGSRNGGAEGALREGIRAANALVWETGHRISNRSGMGTTITTLVLHEDRALVGQVGDSRAYLLRDEKIEQVTEDHSWVAEQVRAGVLTLEEAEMSPYRNIITRSIGAEPEVEPDLFEVKLQPGDSFLLCSDGLTGVVEPDELRQMARDHSPSMAAWRLIELANDRGGPDNITCLILRIDDLPLSTDTEDVIAPGTIEAEEATETLPASPLEEDGSQSVVLLEPEEKNARSKAWFNWKR